MYRLAYLCHLGRLRLHPHDIASALNLCAHVWHVILQPCVPDRSAPLEGGTARAPRLMDAKRLKKSSLVGIKGVTESALSAVLGALRDQGALSDDFGGISRRVLARDLEESVQVPTLYGPPIQSISLPTSSGSISWELVNPFAVLNLLAQKVPGFGSALRGRLAERPCSPDQPWSIIYYTDEASTGNLLHIDPSRKSWLFYWSFKEFGPLLSNESCWFLGGVLRTQRASKVRGGLSSIFKHHLRVFFGSDRNMHDQGVTIHCADGGVLMLWATLGLTLADEAALKGLWSLKGSSGTRPCGRCANVVNHRAGLDLGDTSVLVDSRCADRSRFVRHTNATIWLAAERVVNEVLSPMARRELEMVLGVNANPDSVLLDLDLRREARPADCIFYDFQHCFLVGGVVALEFFLIMEKCRDARILSYSDVHSKLQEWNWPAWVSTPPRKLCDRKHEASSKESGIGVGDHRYRALSHCATALSGEGQKTT